MSTSGDSHALIRLDYPERDVEIYLKLETLQRSAPSRSAALERPAPALAAQLAGGSDRERRQRAQGVPSPRAARAPHARSS